MSNDQSGSSRGSGQTELRKVLTLGDLFGTAIGQVIGAGIMTMTGIAIGMTGRSVPISFVISALIVLISTIPTVIISGTIRLNGGQYSMTALFAGERFAGMFILLFILQQVNIATYSLSFAQYFCSFVPALNNNMIAERLIAAGILTLFYIINLVGVDKAAKAQNLIVILMVVALAFFVIFGLPHVKSGYFTNPGFCSNGIGGVLTASALLTVATSGAYHIVNLSPEAKNATRDIPIAIVASTILVAVLYALIGIVAAGVLPVSRVAGKPLSLVAKTVLPKGLYVFFMIGGAMFALISTLNAQLEWATKPVLQACLDGWLPKGLAKLNKHSVPVYLLTILYLVGLIPILIGVDISTLANTVVINAALCGLIMNFNFFRVDKLIPEEWDQSRFKISRPATIAVTVLTVLTGILTILLELTQLKVPMIIANVVLFVLTFLYATYCEKSGRIHMDLTYQQN